MSPAPASDLGRVGQLVGGKFRLDAVIGRGAMGSVWAATHVTLGYQAAIKLIAREFVRSPEALRRFDAEAKAAARLQSRHVIRVFDSGVLDDGTPYIAMERLTGENLDERLQRIGPMPLAEVVAILAQCCKALTRAHAAAIVHRDIKPENIYLARMPDEEGEVAKVLDFGVAKITMDAEGRTASTGTGTLLGTPIFMSPEQVREAKDVDHRADLYSLGLVAFTSLTGKRAIDGDTFGEVLLQICTHPLPSLCALAPSLPPAMEAWFQRACARERGERHQSAQEFIDTLRVAAAARDLPRPVEATPGPVTPPTLLSRSSPLSDSPAANLPKLAQTASNVSVTAATLSGQPAGVPRVPQGAVLAGVLSAGALAIAGVMWLLFSPHTASESVQSSGDAAVSRPASATALASTVPAPTKSGAGQEVDASGGPSIPFPVTSAPAHPAPRLPTPAVTRAPSGGVRTPSPSPTANPLGY